MKSRIALLALCSLSAGAQILPLMPWPASLSQQPGSVIIDSNFTISVTGPGSSDPRIKNAVERTVVRLSRQTGIPILPYAGTSTSSATLNVVIEQPDHAGPQLLGDNEHYSLEAGNGHIKVSADRPLGALRGIETFLQLVQQNTNIPGNPTAAPGFSIAGVAIRDEPRFGWRGLSLDVSRHFIPIADVKRTLDGMGAVKLNVLHWHLSDDQGFRIESKIYPRLQQYGSDGLYYTQAEVRDVIAYARDRGIRVVPEFDMPGHATSWLVGYPSLGSGSSMYQIARSYGVLYDLMNPAKETTYQFLDGFIGEMSRLFPDEYFHIGGDEVNPKQWNENPAIQAFMKQHQLAEPADLQAYFNRRILKIVTKYGKHMIGWDEILQPDLPKTIVIQSWRGADSLSQAAREGYRGILSAGYYLDLMQPAAQHYAIDPLGGAAAALTAEQKKLILGGEAAMWEELANPENLDAKLWPRLAAIAERLWSPQDVTNATSMYQRLEAVNHWLEWLGLKQRINLVLMRQRLTGGVPSQPLNLFASILEPVKGYGRHADQYTHLTPLNRLVDAIPPESDAAREFRNEVDLYLATPSERRNSTTLRKRLAEWEANDALVRPLLQRNSLLTENIPLADAILALCKAGEEALSIHQGTADWKQRTLATVQDAAQRKGDILIQIAPAIQKLVEAVPVAP